MRSTASRPWTSRLHLSDLVGEADWLLDQDAGTITFGGEKVCAAQVLGSESEEDGTWLWSWANPSVPQHMANDATRVRTYGAAHGISELTSAAVSLAAPVSGEAFALIACELTQADAYYRGPHEGGAVFILLRLPADAPRQVGGDILRAVRTLSYAPMALPVALGTVEVAGYLRGIGLAVSETKSGIVGRSADGQSVTVALDRHGRIASVSSTMRRT